MPATASSVPSGICKDSWAQSDSSWCRNFIYILIEIRYGEVKFLRYQQCRTVLPKCNPLPSNPASSVLSSPPPCFFALSLSLLSLSSCPIPLIPPYAWWNIKPECCGQPWPQIQSVCVCVSQSVPPLLSGILAPSRKSGITCDNCAGSLLLCGSRVSRHCSQPRHAFTNLHLVHFRYLGNGLVALSNLTSAFFVLLWRGEWVGWTISGFGYFTRVQVPHGETLDKMVPLQKRVIWVMCVEECVLERGGFYVNDVAAVTLCSSKNVWCLLVISKVKMLYLHIL